MMIAPLWFVAGVVGIGLLAVGCSEGRLWWRSSGGPESVELADLEQGAPPAQPWLKVGRHVAVFGDAIVRRGESGEIKRVMYPIVPAGHPFLQAAERLRASYGRIGDIPAEQRPKLDGVRTVVIAGPDALTWNETLRDEMRTEPELTGMAFPFAELSLTEQEDASGALRRPDIYDAVVIEARRGPASIVFCLLWLVGGALLVVLAIALFFAPGAARRAARRNAAAAAPASSSAAT